MMPSESDKLQWCIAKNDWCAIGPINLDSWVCLFFCKHFAQQEVKNGESK